MQPRLTTRTRLFPRKRVGNVDRGPSARTEIIAAVISLVDLAPVAAIPARAPFPFLRDTRIHTSAIMTARRLHTLVGETRRVLGINDGKNERKLGVAASSVCVSRFLRPRVITAGDFSLLFRSAEVRRVSNVMYDFLNNEASSCANAPQADISWSR